MKADESRKEDGWIAFETDTGICGSVVNATAYSILGSSLVQQPPAADHIIQSGFVCSFVL
jgi:hypothetical protein